ncbi:MAG: murein transglycosylase A [Bdellovibrionales bacterium]|jgi:membrane-bound lytic murein transglycosylase A
MKRLLGLALLFLAGCAVVPEKPTLVPVSYDALQGWDRDAQDEALDAFQKSCAVLKIKETWRDVCAAARAVPQDAAAARRFFEDNFTPYRFDGAGQGLFTGYYEAQLKGAWTQKGAYQTPLWSRPDDMLTADLGAFKNSLKGQKITGKAQGKAFVPYDAREDVAAGSLAHRAKPLLWVDDPVDAFFLEIQGSGQVLMEDGSVVRVGYDAQNGHGYTPIGRVLAAQGEIEKPVTMQKIRAWLAAHPDKAQQTMNANSSVVFFRKVDRGGAVGAQGVVLTPLRSLAVDPFFVTLGTPVWLETPARHRLVVAQDTGGAIKGAVRGDLFWGAGEAAAEGAGSMQESGTYFLLLPKGAEAP